MREYEAWLGEDVERMQGHTELVRVSMDGMRTKGCDRKARLDWNIIEATAAAVVSRGKVSVKRPGYSHWGYESYCKEYNGDPSTNGMAKEGHVRSKLQGKDGVFVPDKDVTRVEFSNELESEIRRNVSSDFASSTRELEENANGLLNNAAQEAFGIQPGAFAAANVAFLGDDLDRVPQEATVAPVANATTGSVSLSPLRANAQQGFAGGLPSPHPQLQQHSPSTRAGPPAAAFAQPSTSTPGHQPAAAVPKSKPKASAYASACGKAKPKADVGGSGGVNRGRGRPPRDHAKATSAYVEAFVAAGPDDVLFFGAEVSTQLKKLQEMITYIKGRIAGCQEIEAIPHLTMCQKQLVMIYDLCNVLNKHGGDSDAYVETYDRLKTWCLLPPQVAWALPGHLKWMRQKVAIMAQSSSESWYHAFSTEALKDMGHDNDKVAMQQASIISEKLATFLKLPDKALAITKLSDFFHPRMTFNLDDDVIEFVVSFGLMLHPECVKSLQARAAELSDIHAQFEAIVAWNDPQTRADTPPAIRKLVSTLLSFPRGRAIIADSKGYLVRASASAAYMAANDTACENLGSSLQEVVPDFLECSTEALGNTIASVATLRRSIQSAPADILQDCVPNMHCESISGVMSSFLSKVVASWTPILIAVLNAEATEASLMKWADKYESRLKRLGQLTEAVLESRGILVDAESGACRAVSEQGAIGSWLMGAREMLVANNFSDVHACKRLVSDVSTVFHPPDVGADLGVLADWIALELPQAFMKSPLMKTDGKLLSSISSTAFENTAILDQLVEDFFRVINRDDGGCPDVRALVKSGSLASWEMRDSAFADAVKWAGNIGDSQLINQLSFMHHFQLAIKHTVEVMEYARKNFAEGVPYASRVISVAAVDLLKRCRAKAHGLSAFVATNKEPGVFTIPTAAPENQHWYHYKRLDGLFDMEKAHANFELAYTDVSDMFRSTWSHDVRTLMDTIVGMLPDWAGQKESFMTNRELCNEFCAWSSYGKVGPMCAALKQQVKLVKKMQEDGREHIVDPVVIKDPDVDADDVVRSDDAVAQP